MLLIRRQTCEMLAPDPANLLRQVILVLSKPQLPLLGDDIKDLTAALVKRKEGLNRHYSPRQLDT